VRSGGNRVPEVHLHSVKGFLSAAAAVAAAAAALTVALPFSGGDAKAAPAELLEVRRTAAELREQLRKERRSSDRAITRLRRQLARDPDVRHAIRLGAAAYGVSADRMRRVAHCESTLDPGATNGRYTGLFQFGTPLWSRTPFRDFSRTDPYAASFAASWAFARGMSGHWPVCGSR
jgi:hypothetical protein